MDACRAKAEWGQSYVELFKRHLHVWNREPKPPYTTRKDFQPEHQRFVLFVDDVRSIPITLPLFLGDALHNFRCALDHAAWILANLKPLPPKTNENLIQFPIYSSETTFDAMVDSRLPGVDAKFRDYMKSVQPFSSSPARAWLAFLATYNNIDKHRNVRPMLVRPIDTQFTVTDPEHFEITQIESPLPSGFVILEKDAELLYVSGKPLPGGDPNVKMNIKGTYTLAFDDGSLVGEMLDPLFGVISQILDEIEALL